MLKHQIVLILVLFLWGCKNEKENSISTKTPTQNTEVTYAKGFSVEKQASGITLIKVLKPWVNSEKTFTYALIPKEILATITLNKNEYDEIISTPLENMVVTSTTHIPALEELGILDKLIGFPDTKYISSKAARNLIDSGKIKELGVNENLNTEAVLALQPDLVFGFAINNSNNTYETIQRAKIPVVYNGDWVEETPLGKAEWIKFFALFFNKTEQANAIFTRIEKSYLEAKKIASKATYRPTVLCGALYKDVWYLPGGKSWAANFLQDANSNYLWNTTDENGSLSLSWESVLDVGQHADYWIGPAQYLSYQEMKSASQHYSQFNAFQSKKIFTTANTIGETGGTLYYELAPQRPDLVLKDLIHILHPGLLPNYEPFFFKPLL
ncbi:ABC transporter substrate-binding protein [Maribacter hydrothermalis]|uniref:ABC transporter substrate-binding protein n=1 Tax=Maribacter hydrothermalis TaxID=1836467 RepID=A0A1B7Z7T0_9FLAO|nr:ABC transporter substrate-binding protein [Maribacter hydrothermalis]APQ15876.1 ABC transporter substrate-binding protein [Maribacter hydrothermalis]OBR38745.1 ABC transporter substrate-binding protein [Maribacter hydrothermalis]